MDFFIFLPQAKQYFESTLVVKLPRCLLY